MSIAEYPSRAPEVEVLPTNLAQVGFELFINASLNYPASVSAQAAFITSEAREHDHNLELIKLHLLNSDTKIQQIMQAGNSRHKERKKEVKELTPARVRKIVTNDFDRAADFRMCLTDELLAEIRDEIYPYYFKPRNEPSEDLMIENIRKRNGFAEDLMKNAVTKMLRGAYLVRPWRDSNPQP